MAWFKGPTVNPQGQADARAAQAAAAERSAAWEKALAHNKLPPFVEQRLVAAAERRTPWMATMTAAELLLARSHGIRPLATVTGACWFQFGRSWTEGHATGWRTALARLKEEAVACQASAVVDVRMKTTPSGGHDSMDYTLVGTALRVDRLPPSVDPVIATTPALEFVRLLEAGVVPTGLAVGAYYEWLTDYGGNLAGSSYSGNQPLKKLGAFWEKARRHAHADLRNDAAKQGNGVLAHTQFGQLIKQEQEKGPDMYLGRHIVIGTTVQVVRGQGVPHNIESVVDMRDDLSPLTGERPSAHTAYSTNETEGSI